MYEIIKKLEREKLIGDLIANILNRCSAILCGSNEDSSEILLSALELVEVVEKTHLKLAKSALFYELVKTELEHQVVESMLENLKNEVRDEKIPEN
jgi:hypothetical protein